MKLKKILIAAMMLCVMSVSAHAQDEVLVDAAASLKDVLADLAPVCLKETGVKLTPNLAASGLLAKQIEAGAPVDIFIAADEATMDEVEKGGFIVPGSRAQLLGNSMVVVVPVNSTLKIEAAKDLTQAGVAKLAIGDPATVPAGHYAQIYLEQEKVWDALKSKLVPLDNVRTVLTAVASRNADAGMVYRTDAMGNAQVKVAFSVPPGALKIIYPVAVIKNSKVPAAAAKVREFLLGDKARAVFDRFGFSAPPKADAATPKPAAPAGAK